MLLPAVSSVAAESWLNRRSCTAGGDSASCGVRCTVLCPAPCCPSLDVSTAAGGVEGAPLAVSPTPTTADLVSLAARDKGMGLSRRPGMMALLLAFMLMLMLRSMLESPPSALPTLLIPAIPAMGLSATPPWLYTDPADAMDAVGGRPACRPDRRLPLVGGGTSALAAVAIAPPTRRTRTREAGVRSPGISADDEDGVTMPPPPPPPAALASMGLNSRMRGMLRLRPVAAVLMVRAEPAEDMTMLLPPPVDGGGGIIARAAPAVAVTTGVVEPAVPVTVTPATPPAPAADCADDALLGVTIPAPG